MEIRELQLITNQLEETETFYNQILNIPTQDKSENERSFLIGKTRLSFVLGSEDHPVYHLAFDIPKIS